MTTASKKDAEATAGEDEIDEIECSAIIARHDSGRLALIEKGELEIFPIRYALDGKWVVFCAPPGLDLDRANLARLALGIDEVDRYGQNTVVVRGSGCEITDGLDDASVRERRIVPPWDKSNPRWVRIVPRAVTGRHWAMTTV